mgnify:CR=1 FL=1
MDKPTAKTQKTYKNAFKNLCAEMAILWQTGYVAFEEPWARDTFILIITKMIMVK